MSKVFRKWNKNILYTLIVLAAILMAGESVAGVNIPPATMAGADKAITSPTLSVYLGDATINDTDSGPAPVTAFWTANPSTAVTFSSANSVNTTVTFANVGIYSLILTGDDSADATSDSVTVYVYQEGLRVDYDVDNSSVDPGRIHKFQIGYHSYFESDGTAPSNRIFPTAIGITGVVQVVTENYTHLRSGLTTVAEFTNYDHLNGLLNDVILQNDPLGSPLTITLEGIKKGKYYVRSWHHTPEPNQNPGPITIHVTDDYGRREVANLHQGTGFQSADETSEDSYVLYLVKSDGINPISIEMRSLLIGTPGPINKWTVCNGFEVVPAPPGIPRLDTNAQNWNLLE